MQIIKKIITIVCLLFINISFYSCENEEMIPPVTEQIGDQSLSGSGSGCTNLTYNGPTNDVQLQTWCQLAQVYECQGNDAGVEINCKNIDDFCNSCDCPYC